jgi:hypothetical protein
MTSTVYCCKMHSTMESVGRTNLGFDAGAYAEEQRSQVRAAADLRQEDVIMVLPGRSNKCSRVPWKKTRQHAVQRVARASVVGGAGEHCGSAVGLWKQRDARPVAVAEPLAKLERLQGS